MSTATGTATRSSSLLLTGLVLLSLCLRGPLVAVSTVTTDLTADLGMTATAVGLLTTLPVLCFGVAAPGASVVISRLGVERAALTSLLGIFIGILVRSAGGVPAALAGTVVMGLAITVGNVVAPIIIGRDFRGRAAMMTGTYTAVLNIGSMIMLTVTGPVAAQLGWQAALAIWAVVPLVAGLVWWPLARRRTAAAAVPNGPTSGPAKGPKSGPKAGPKDTTAAPEPDSTSAAGSTPPAPQQAPARTGVGIVLRRPATWMLTLAFAGQAFAYYGMTAWLPSLLGDEQGMTRGQAGAASSIFQIAALIGAFGTPVIINRFGGPLVAFLVNGVLWSFLPLGLLFDSDLWALWSALSGAAQGGGFVCVFTVVVLRARNLRENRLLSSIVQTGGYTIACLGPVVLGALHDATGAWSAPLLAAFAAVATLTILGALSARGLRG
ncbi:MFS transporter [Nakamurella sp. GG22]